VGLKDVTNVKSFADNMKHLLYVDLSDNQISNFKLIAKAFSASQNLQKIRLHGNPIRLKIGTDFREIVIVNFRKINEINGKKSDSW